MKVVSIKENYKYIEFNKQKDFYEYLEILLEDGYELIENIHLCIKLRKEDNEVLLSHIKVDNLNDIEGYLRSLDRDYELIYPNYEKCILNDIASIRKYYDKDYWYKPSSRMDELLSEKDYKNIIIILLDGMGSQILENHLPDNSFLRKHWIDNNIAIFPSTTAASTTSTKNGLAPIRTGWTGWENYFREINRNLVLFNGTNYDTDEKTGFDTYKVLPYKFFYSDLNVDGKIIEPDFSKKKRQIKDVLNKSLKSLNPLKRNIHYVYFANPDGLLHEYGTKSKLVTSCLIDINKKIEKYVEKLPKDTLVFISADHGHIDINSLDIYECKTILKMLNRRPANDSRCTSFSVKKEYHDKFIDIFNKIYGYGFNIYRTSELIKMGYFGNIDDPVHERCGDFLADFIAIGIKEYNFNYKGPEKIIFKSHHAGLTINEMLVPVIVYKK